MYDMSSCIMNILIYYWILELFPDKDIAFNVTKNIEKI